MSVTQPSFLKEQSMKRLFWILSICILVIMPLLSHSYGQTGDEWLQLEYGRDIWNYFFKGDKLATDYSQKSLQYQGQEYYGGLFDYAMELLHRALPSVPLLLLRHFCNALCGAVLMIFTGLLARRLSNSWLTGALALLFIFFSPRIFGESMNNPKDIPFACGFIVAVYSFIALLQKLPALSVKHLVGLAIGFGVAFGVRSAGGLLLIAYLMAAAGLYLLVYKERRKELLADRKKLTRFTALVILALLAGYAIGLAAWPWGLQDPISRPIESLKAMTNREIVLRVFFEGEYYANNRLPSYYELKWIAMSNPLVVVAGMVLFIFLVGIIRRQYNFFVYGFVLFGAFFPPLYMIYKHSSVHDTWRHLFFVYPFFVIAAAIAWTALGTLIRNGKYRYLGVAVALAGLLPAVIWTVRSHPNQTVYFNELVGGVKGAYGQYETDYYQNSGLQAAQWVIRNAKAEPGRKVIVLSNLSGIGYYFEKDTARISANYGRYGERSTKDWDYFITYSRFVPGEVLWNGQWPPSDAIHIVAADGVPLSVVLKRKSKESIAAFEALQKNDFATAIARYQAHLQKDPSDDRVFYFYAIALASANQVDPAIAAMQKASAMDPSNVEYYQLLARLYQAKGDQANAQQAMNRANEIILREQEKQEE